MSIAAENKYTERQLVNLGEKLIRNMGDFERALETWLDLPIVDCTWVAFKAHFEDAQTRLKRVRGPTMRSTSFQQAANAITAEVMNQVKGTMENERHEMFNKIEETENKILNAVTASSSPPPAPQPTNDNSPIHQTINMTTNDVTIKILELLKELQQDMKEHKKRPPPRTNYKRNGNNDNNGNKKKKGNRRTDISIYCWSCGAWNHTSRRCRRKKEGHKDEATFDNKMGGSTLYCQESNAES